MLHGDVGGWGVPVGSEEVEVFVVLLALDFSVTEEGLWLVVLVAVGSEGGGFEVGEGSVVGGFSEFVVSIRILLLNLIRHLLQIIIRLLRQLRQMFLHWSLIPIKFPLLLRQLPLPRLKLSN